MKIVKRVIIFLALIIVSSLGYVYYENRDRIAAIRNVVKLVQKNYQPDEKIQKFSLYPLGRFYKYSRDTGGWYYDFNMTSNVGVIGVGKKSEIALEDFVEYELISTKKKLSGFKYYDRCTYSPVGSVKYPPLQFRCSKTRKILETNNFIKKIDTIIKEAGHVYIYEKDFPLINDIKKNKLESALNLSLYKGEYNFDKYVGISSLRVLSQKVELDNFLREKLEKRYLLSRELLDKNLLYEKLKKAKVDYEYINICDRGYIGNLIAYKLNFHCSQVDSKKMSELRSLSIGYSNLTKLDYNSFDGLESLEELDLSHNEIEDISFLSKLTQLKRLNLTNTKISYLVIDTIRELPQLEELYLSNTPFEKNELSMLGHMVDYRIRSKSKPYNYLKVIREMIQLKRELFYNEETPLSELVSVVRRERGKRAFKEKEKKMRRIELKMIEVREKFLRDQRRYIEGNDFLKNETIRENFITEQHKILNKRVQK